jgi:hypothetical protein
VLEELDCAGSTKGDDQLLREEDRLNHAHGARDCGKCGDGEGKRSCGDDRSEVLESIIPPRPRDRRQDPAGEPTGGLPWCALNPPGSPIFPEDVILARHPGSLLHTQGACCVRTS